MTDKEKEKVEYTRPKDEGEVDKRRFAGIMGLAGTAMAVALVTFFSIGMVGAAMGVGIGGFVANFEEVSYDGGNAQIYPVIGSSAACDNAPQLQASLAGSGNDAAELIGGVEFFKDLPLPEAATFNEDDFARITIIGNGTDGIQVEDLNLRLSALETEELSLDSADIQEFGPGSYSDSSNDTTADGSYVLPETSGNITDADSGVQSTAEFGIEADSFNLPQGGTAAVHQVSLGSITLDEVNIAVQILNESEDTENGPVTRVVNPTERSCDGLADASTSSNFTNVNNATGGLSLADPS
ncbi:hypothetical protein EGH25_03785 [Haladaptatus sp. F3-133]|uniref:Uncharacterized protein n=1 Tax=Halorutilus salinus TaxID=2487751 RepID=A0A9Q4C3U7_9EURY|nr:hypothetical protein [Halorutilus salinus]MCX2818474.1 hypothetical protein [Halorutilus salinus]